MPKTIASEMLTDSSPVKDKQKSLELALKLSKEIFYKMMKSIAKDSSDFEDDPAEHIYLTVHIVGMLSARIALLFDAYSKTYGIEKMTNEKVHEWITLIAMENIKAAEKSK